MQDVLLVGFGAVGAMYTFILKQSGRARVTVVARSNYNIVNSQGIHIISRKYGEVRNWRPDRLFNSVSAAADMAYSYVIVATKAIPELNRTSDLLKALFTAPYVNQHTQPTYVLVQNGLNVERDLYKSLIEINRGRPRIISTAVWIGANLRESNVVEHNDFDRMTIGIYRHQDYTTTENTPEEAALLSDFGSLLEAGGTTLTVVPEIQRKKFSKNFWNVAFSSFSTLTGYPLPALFREPPTGLQSYSPYVFPKTAESINNHTIPAIRAMLKELLAVGHAMGFPDTDDGLPSSTVDTLIENTTALHRSPESVHRPSMLLDAERGLPIEVEVIFGEVVRLAREYKIDIPRIEMLYALLLVVQNQILRKLESQDSVKSGA